MKNDSMKEKNIPASDVTELVIHSILSENSPISISFSGKNYNDRMLELTKLYLAVQRACKELDTVTRKTYHLKESTVAAFEAYSKACGLEMGKVITELMIEFLHAPKDNVSRVTSQPKEPGETYTKKSFRIPHSVALMFQETCNEQKVPAGPMLQFLIEFHITKKERD